MSSMKSSRTQTSPQQISEEEIFTAHLGGKLSVEVAGPLADQRDLSIVYTPGVAQVSRAIAAEPELAASHTWASRLVAVISDGTAVLGLGDIGASASLPVMEGKSALFKRFGGLNSIPIVLDTTDTDEIVETIVRIAPTFGAINLEDISAPRCFEIERRLIEALEMPVMHDDQHGTAVVVLAALYNALEVVGKEIGAVRVVISGAGAAGIAVGKMLLAAGVGDLIVLDSRATLHTGRTELEGEKREMAARSNPRGVAGGPAEALAEADVFIGVSSSRIAEEDIARMAKDAVIFALSNPDPEVDPAVAHKYAAIVATGRSDYPNQINNVLAFPGIFRGALDSGARRITEAMKLAAARAIAELIEHPVAEEIVPSAFTPGVAEAVARAVMESAVAGD